MYGWFNVGLIIALVGFVVSGFFASIMMLVAGFNAGLWWGLTMLFLPGVPQVAFLFVHWDAGRKPFLTAVMGNLLLVAGLVIMFHAANAGDVGWAQPWFDEIVQGVEQVARMEEHALPRSVRADADEEDDIDSDPERPPKETLVGRTLDEVVERFGYPRMRLSHGGMTIYHYDLWEFEADANGMVVREIQIDP